MSSTGHVEETMRLLALAGRLTQAGEHARAIETYRTIAGRHPAAPAGWRQLAAASAQHGRRPAAAVALKRALTLAPEDGATTRLLLFIDLAGTPAARHRALAMAALTNPAEARAMGQLASSYQLQDRTGPAERCARQALAADPSLVEVRMNLAVILRNNGQVAASRAELRRAAILQPAALLTWRRIAISEELLSNLAGAEAAARRALAVDRRDHDAAIVLAFVRRRTGRIEAALQGLAALPDRLLGEIKRDVVEFELGALHDRLGETDAAFAHFTRGNALALARAAPGTANAAAYVAEVRAHAQALAASYVRRWRPARPVDPPPVFMVGFPRSGTTLLDQVLDAHPEVRVLEELPILSAVANRLARPHATLPERLADLTEPQIGELRATYSALRERYAGPDAPAMVIDKMPLNIALTGLILRMYPNARIVLSLRHPCDVCLSCFMQPFRLNPSMANFVDLDSATRLYALVMRVWLRARQALSPDHVAVRYEDLIEDVEGHARRTVAFLGLEWDDRVLGHLEHARSRGLIRTPSFRQVTEPIYTRARGRWHRYRAHLEPFMDRLDPFIDEFGYREDG